MRSIGSSLFKPQTVLLALEPRRGTRRNSAASGLEHGSRANRPALLWFLWPLLGGDDASMAPCGVIRCSGEPWFGRKDEEGEI
jgi:hypothetical protein